MASVVRSTALQRPQLRVLLAWVAKIKDGSDQKTKDPSHGDSLSHSLVKIESRVEQSEPTKASQAPATMNNQSQWKITSCYLKIICHV